MITYILKIFRNKLLLFLIIIFCKYTSSCGLKTPPQNIPEIKSKSTINNLNVIQKGNRIRLSWVIFEIERINALKKLYKDPFENESERNAIFGKHNFYYKKLKNRLPKFSIDLICKWFQDNFNDLDERTNALKKWYNEQFDNGEEKGDAFRKLNNKVILQDYFVIKEEIKPFDCIDCKYKLNKIINVNFSSKSIVREGNNFYYYLEIPKKDLYFREYKLSHHGPNKEFFSPVKKIRFRKANLFPKIPTPTFKIIQIEDAKQTFKFAFGNLVIKKSTLDDDLKKEKKENLSLKKIKNPNNNEENRLRKFFLKISWPVMHRISLKRFRGSGDYFEENNNFQVNLYRIRNNEYWPETPINTNSNSKNFFLDKIKLYLNTTNTKKVLDLKQKRSSSIVPFYVDFKGQNSDTWLYKIRLVDSFGNESLASETITVNLPKVKIDGQNISN